MKVKTIDNYSNYQISDDGRVFNKETGYEIQGGVKKTGYREVGLINNQGQRYKLVHRIVAEAFCPRPEGATEVNHINGDKTDNRACNLEWVTHADNLKHAYETGLMPNNTTPRSVVCTEITTGIKRIFPSIYVASKVLRISQGNICMACKKQRPYAGGYWWEYEGA